ncbi:MAG: EpsG family protein [Clostridiales bacterium]|nr:EpsG family protein [Clostridiales bacterium]
MTLTNYWWLLIWVFVGGGIIAFIFPKRNEIVLGKREARWSIPAALLFVAPLAIWSGNRLDNFGDTATYRRIFTTAPAALSELPEYLSENSKDQGFTVLTTLFKTIFGNSDVLFFMVIAIFQILCLVLIYRKYSSNFWISIFLFVASTDYLSWMHNGTRQFIAVAGIFACFGLIVRKKYIPTIIIILLLSTIHASALIMIPIIFIIQGRAWNKKTILFMLCVGIAILFVDQFTTILDDMLAETQYSDLVTNDIWSSDDGTSILRILVYSVPAIFSIIGKKYVDEADDPVINICVNASACTMILYALAGVSSGIYIGRLPIYTTLMGYISLPWLIDHMFTRESSRLIKFIMVGAYLVFFYYQMHFSWGVL